MTRTFLGHRGTEQENGVKLNSVSVLCHTPRDAFPWLIRTDPPPNPSSRWAEPPVAPLSSCGGQQCDGISASAA